MLWMIFADFEAAEAAQAAIAARFGLGGPGHVTARWADPVPLTGGRWAIPSPEGEAGADIPLAEFLAE